MALLGRTEPRIYTPPLRELDNTSSLGFLVIAFANNVLGVKLYPWQEWLLIHMLEIVGTIGGEWYFRYRTVLVIVARQNGKTLLSKVLSLFFLYVLGVPLVLGTAQSLELSERVWSEVIEDIEGNQELFDEVFKITKANGKKSLLLTGGREYRVAAASRKGGRGMSGDLILLDELREHQSWDAWSAVSKTTMARPNALVLATTNAGDATSVVLRHLRRVAHAYVGDPDGIASDLELLGRPDDEASEALLDDTLGIFEWSAPQGCDVFDKEAWTYANPSLGYGTLTERALRSAAATDPEKEFRTECLSQEITATIESVFPDDSWERAEDPDAFIAPDSELFFGVDMASDRNRCSIAVCGRRPDRSWLVEVLECQNGIKWIQDWFADRAGTKQYGKMRVAVQANGAPISSVYPVLELVDGVEMIEVAGKDLAAYHGRFYDGIACHLEDGGYDATPIWHRRDAELDMAAALAVSKPLGDSAWAFSREKSIEDISPLMACVMAFGAATAVEPRKKVSAYASEEAEVCFL